MPINYRLAPVEIRAILDEVSPRPLAVEDHWASQIPDSVFAGRREAVLSIGRDQDGWPGESVYEELRDASPEDDGWSCKEDDDALLLYTGGTTG